VARLDSQKGYDYLIPTLPHLLKQFPDIHFAWVGEGDQKAALERQLETYGVRSAVSLLGYRQDVPQLLQAADLFVFPSHYEGFPFAVLEAMAAGVPIVASATNAIPELIEDGIHGRLCRTGDSCDLLETLRWALQHPDAMQMMAEQASNHVARFSEVAMIQETLAALETIGGSD
jgi:glycosyltransferase involved in cell wall biosynthesis